MADPDLTFDLRLEPIGDEVAATVVVAGEVDAASSPELRQRLDEVLARHGGVAEVRLDLAAVTFLDSSGLAVLLAHRDHGGRSQRLVLLSPSKEVRRVLEITATGGLFELRERGVAGEDR